jgi:hypothetical protein
MRHRGPPVQVVVVVVVDANERSAFMAGEIGNAACAVNRIGSNA